MKRSLLIAGGLLVACAAASVSAGPVADGDTSCAATPAAASAGKAANAAPTAPPGCTPVTTFVDNTTPVTIIDASVVTSEIVVAGAGPWLWDVDVTTFITHTFAADLDITITSPAGTVVTLTTDNGAGSDNVFNGTVWDDSANPGGQVPYIFNDGLVTDHAYATNVLAPWLVPEEPLGAFVGEDPNGTWTLTISDDLAGDVGMLTSWSLDLTTFAAAPFMSPVQSFEQTVPLEVPTGPSVVTSTIEIAGQDAPLCNLKARTTLNHTYAADIDMTLMSPSGTVVTLTTDNGTGHDNVFGGTLWSDTANPGGQVPYGSNNGLVTDHLYVNLVVPELAPEEAMAAFMGEDPNGTWTLTISDDQPGDGGTLVDWGLELVTCTCSQADLGLSGSASATVIPGEVIGYALTLRNLGPDAATDVALSLSTPAGTSFSNASVYGSLSCTTPAVGGTGAIECTSGVPLASGAELQLGLVLRAEGSATPGDVISFTAEAAGSLLDPVPGNNRLVLDTAVVAPQADLVLTGTASPSLVAPGDALSYTVVATNLGPEDVTDALVSVDLPDFGCTWTAAFTAGAMGTAAGAGDIAETLDLPEDGIATYTVTCTVPPGAVSGTVATTGSIASTLVVDPVPGNNSFDGSADVVVAGGALVSGSKTVSGDFRPGGAITWTVVLSNSGDRVQGDNAGDEFTDVLPAQVTGVSAVASSGTATLAGDTVTWNGAIAVGGSVTITIEATLAADATGSVSNQGSIRFDADGDDSNEAMALTDDPALAGPADATVFGVAPVAPPVVAPVMIPAADTRMLLALALLLGLVATRRLR